MSQELLVTIDYGNTIRCDLPEVVTRTQKLIKVELRDIGGPELYDGMHPLHA